MKPAEAHRRTDKIIVRDERPLIPTYVFADIGEACPRPDAQTARIYCRAPLLSSTTAVLHLRKPSLPLRLHPPDPRARSWRRRTPRPLQAPLGRHLLRSLWLWSLLSAMPHVATGCASAHIPQ